MREKSGKEREQNESFERELRPWNAPAPIDEMEFKPKCQKVKNTKRKREMKKRMKKQFKKEGDT